MTMRWMLLLVVWWLPGIVRAQATRYSAFDLIGNELKVQIPSGAKPGDALANFNCRLTPAGTSLAVEVTAGTPCSVFFANPEPRDLVLDMVTPGKPAPVPVTVTLEFDRGTPALSTAEYDAESHKLVLGDASVAGKIAAFLSLPVERWVELDVADGKAIVPPSAQLKHGTALYFRAAKDRPITKAWWRPARASAEPTAPPAFDAVCEPVARKQHMTDNSATWEIHLDGTHRRLDVLEVARVVDPNTWGIVFVSQPAATDAVISEDDTIQIATPTMATGTATSGSSALGAARSPEPEAPPPICTWHLIAPHAPGPFKVTAKLFDVASDRSKPVAERRINLIVQTRYAGAFRTGVAGIIGAEDRKFESRTSPGTMQPEIVRTSHTPFELVVGYSLFFDGIRGRRYVLRDGSDNILASRLGLFLGFGTVSVTSDNIDFLKSLHVGLEIELTPNIAVAVTAVGRRIDQLSGSARVGGPAPATIPIEQTYALGGAVVVNIHPGFFRFAKGK
jgi:hypothetical protein